jgi:cytidylate kinase
MIITISGIAGSGKTTVGKLIAEKLGYKFYDIGTLRKQMAKARGMTIEEFNKLGETDSSTDKDADAFTINLAKSEKDFVMQGRTAYYFIPHSVKIYLTVSPQVAAKRVSLDNFNPDRNSASKSATIEQIEQLCKDRDASDALRYKKIYGIENFADPKNYDLVLDTTNLSIAQVADTIIDYAKSKK